MIRQFTSESVTEGHPDKICDQISDAVLDAILEQDPQGRVACETCATTGLVLVMGEITSQANIDIQQIARNVILDIGYTDGAMGLNGNSCAVVTAINKQSVDIASGVSRAKETRDQADDEQQTGAGDQGMMFGYATDETPELMPMPLVLAHHITRRMAKVRKDGTCPWMRPDGKAQVTVDYDNGTPVAINTVVLSTQHNEDVSHEQIEQEMLEKVILPVLPKELVTPNTRYLINPSGRFVIGGPTGDSGLTGRKIIVDTYGGFAAHGGGCFSGKDPTKVDRSAAYAARHVAKNIVKAGLAKRCMVSLAYAIGVAQPVGFAVDTYGTGTLEDDVLSRIIHEKIDLRPDSIIRRFGLRRPIYRQTATYGHFGRDDLNLPWEDTALAGKLLEWVEAATK